MSKEKKKVHNSTDELLKKLISLVERLVICQEQRLSGRVIENFNSAEYIKGGS